LILLAFLLLACGSPSACSGQAYLFITDISIVIEILL